MSGTIETITDRSAFEKIFYENFSSGDLFLKTSNGNLKIAFLGYTDGQIAFRIPYIKSMPDTALVFARREETTVYIEIKTVEKQESDVFIFTPLKVQVIYSSRREDRMSVGNQAGAKSLLFVTNAASDFNLYDSISLEKKKMLIIKDKILSDLKKIFTDVVVYFCSEDIGDPRMRYFRENANAPILIANIDKPEPGKEAVHAFYKEFIYSKEQYNMKRKGLISEISVPVLYKGMIPFGFIQINSSVTLDPSYLQILLRVASLSDQMTARGGIFKGICTDRLLVSDVSRGGIGIVFKDRKYIRFFKENGTVSFDLTLPNGSIVLISATVKNIVLQENKVIKVGCAIRQIDPKGKSQYDTFISSHAPEEKPAAAVPPVPAASPKDDTTVK